MNKNGSERQYLTQHPGAQALMELPSERAKKKAPIMPFPKKNLEFTLGLIPWHQ